MAYALCLKYDNDKFYIHKLFDLSSKTTPKVSKNNQNNAKLFSSEASAKNWADKNKIPYDYEVVFVVAQLPKQEREKTESQPTYKKLNRGSMDESLPNFLKM